MHRKRSPGRLPSSCLRSIALAAVLALAPFSAVPLQAQSLNDLLGDLQPESTPQSEPELNVALSSEGALEAGATLTLSVQLRLAPDAYTYSQNPSFGGATEISISEIYGVEAIDETFAPDRKPKVAFEELVGQDLEKFHGGVTWTRKFRYTGNVPADQIYLSGSISYQVCDDRNCRPMQEDFTVFPDDESSSDLSDAGTSMAQAEEAAGSPLLPQPPFDPPLTGGESDARSSGGSAAAASSAEDVSSMRAPLSEEELKEADAPFEFNLQTKADEGSLPWYLGMAFLGGLILNVMPCVLPVLAIKVMSFVQQAGESRGRALALNLSYAFGVVAVFLLLATLAVTLRIGWGGLFQLPEFNLAMIAIVFAMGLSMLGVFEIPIPGMIGSTGGQHREGLLGAFLIGIFATILATPCSGPLMTTVLAWSVKQETLIVYLVWGVMGLGMASPFLVFGMVPGLARFIPRPGEWMVRFKEFSGFALLAAALWLMNSLPSEVILPTLIMLLGIGIGLWMVGSLYDHSSPVRRKMLVRFYALTAAVIIGWFGFGEYNKGLARSEARRNQERLPIAAAEGSATRNGVDSVVVSTAAESGNSATSELPWETFSSERLMQLLRDGRPVLIDFTADWCLICKQNEKIALNTRATSDFVRKHGVVTLYADYTRTDPEIQEWLEKFNSISVPLTVIFPQGDPQNPIILDGPYTQSSLLAYLEQAVVSEVAADTRSSTLLEALPH